MKKYMLAGLVMMSLSMSTSAKPLNLPGKPDDEKLAHTLAKELVKRSDIYTSISYYYGSAGDPNPAKLKADLNLGNIDITWFGTTSALETELNAVYFPLYRGLLGMRLPIVEQEKIDTFKFTKTLSDLKKFKACQGKLWADTFILEANGLSVAKSLKYPNLFPMLEGDRCDYFPRGVFEPFAEIKHQSQYNLAVDKHIMLRYRMPYYLFTAKDKPELADHLTGLLAEMFEDGSYQKLFFAEREVKEALELGNLSKRVVFDLDNPDLTTKSKQIPEKYWFDPLKGQ